MTSCLRYCACLPSEELQERMVAIDGYCGPHTRYDLAKRLTVIAALITLLAGAILIGLACCQLAHPMLGCGLVLGSFVLFCVASCISSCHGRYHEGPLDTLYHPNRRVESGTGPDPDEAPPPRENDA